MKRIGLITTLWKRPGLTRVFLEYYQTMSLAGVELIGSLTKDEGDADLREDLTIWHAMDCPNTPRSDKWNGAADTLRRIEAGVQGAFVIGSDDFLSPAYIEAMLALDADYVSPTDCYFYDPTEPLAGYGRFDRVGAGRYLSRRALEACDFAPWLPGTNRNADYAMGQRVGQHVKPVMISCRDKPILDVKGFGNIWSYTAVRSAAPYWEEIPIRTAFPDWIEGHFPGLHERLRRLVLPS